jgi:hypothetical protein
MKVGNGLQPQNGKQYQDLPRTDGGNGRKDATGIDPGRQNNSSPPKVYAKASKSSGPYLDQSLGLTGRSRLLSLRRKCIECHTRKKRCSRMRIAALVVLGSLEMVSSLVSIWSTV